MLDGCNKPEKELSFKTFDNITLQCNIKFEYFKQPSLPDGYYEIAILHYYIVDENSRTRMNEI